MLQNSYNFCQLLLFPKFGQNVKHIWIRVKTYQTELHITGHLHESKSVYPINSTFIAFRGYPTTEASLTYKLMTLHWTLTLNNIGALQKRTQTFRAPYFKIKL